jgi:predicted secreted protein
MPQTWDAVSAAVGDATTCYEALEDAGLRQSRGMWKVDRPLTPEQWMMMQYPCEEWDYAYELAPGFKGQVSWYCEIPE